MKIFTAGPIVVGLRTIFTAGPWLGPFSPQAPNSTEPNDYGAGGENHFHCRSVARTGGENGPLYNPPPPPSSYPSYPFLLTIFSAISHHVVQDFGPLLKY